MDCHPRSRERTQNDGEVDEQPTAFGAYCANHGLLEVNPWDGLQSTLKESTRGGLKKIRRPYTVEEFGKLVAALGGDAVGSALLPLALLSAYSGCRIEELCAMKLENVTERGVLRGSRQVRCRRATRAYSPDDCTAGRETEGDIRRRLPNQLLDPRWPRQA